LLSCAAVTRTLALALSLALSGSFVARVRADGPYEGEWRAGAMRIDVTVESWGGDCGPRPQSTSVPGGRTVRVTQAGDDLTFAGRPQRTTRGCWSENAAVRRVSSRYEGGTWTIVCRTPEEDPRAEVGTYTLRAVSPQRIEFRDVSRYDWQLNESHCIAGLTSTQVFERVGAGDTTARPEPDPTPARPDPTPEREPACTPGAAARIAIRPPQAEIEPGGRACFSARVVDASGCALPGRTPQLELRAPEGAIGALQRTCFQAASSAAEAEGEFTIVARDGALEAQARVRVRTPDLSDLIARRAEGGGAVSLGDGEDATSEEAARVAARQDGAARPSLMIPSLLAVLGALLVLGATIGLIVRGRRRKRKLAQLDDAASAAASGPASAPFAEGTPAVIEAPGAPVVLGAQKICPTCRRGYPLDATKCATDGTELVLYADFVAGKGAPGALAQTKVCPVCGARFPATTRFCGKDGTTLVDG
jgi:hypothetical protein